MPKLNSAGVAVLNGVNGPLTVNGQTLVPQAGSADWRDDQTLVAQVPASGDWLVSVVGLNGSVVPVAPRGAVPIVAGGGQWAARLEGFGYFDSYGHTAPDWYPLDVDRTSGVILVCLSYSTGSGLATWDGATLTTLYAGALNPQRDGAIDGGLVVSKDAAGQILTFPNQNWTSIPIINVALAGGYVCGWHTALNAFVLWDAASGSTGWALSTGANYDSDVVRLGGLVRVVASLGAGELPGELLQYDVDPSASTVNGKPVARVDLAAPAPLVIPEFPPTSKAIAIGIVDDPTGPEIIGFDDKTQSWGTPSPRTVAVFVDTRHQPERIEGAKALAARIGVPVEAYGDSRWEAGAPDCRPCLQAYIAPGESLVTFQLAMTTALDLWQEPVDLYVRAFTGMREDGTHAVHPQAVLDAMRVCWDLARTHDVGAIWCFADQRRDGLPAFPEFSTAIARMRAASADWMAFPTSEDDPMPGVIPDGPERDAILQRAGEAYDRQWGSSNGPAMVREINDRFRAAHGIDGDPVAWMSIAKAKHEGHPDVAGLIADQVRLRRGC